MPLSNPLSLSLCPLLLLLSLLLFALILLYTLIFPHPPSSLCPPFILPPPSLHPPSALPPSILPPSLHPPSTPTPRERKQVVKVPDFDAPSFLSSSPLKVFVWRVVAANCSGIEWTHSVSVFNSRSDLQGEYKLCLDIEYCTGNLVCVRVSESLLVSLCCCCLFPLYWHGNLPWNPSVSQSLSSPRAFFLPEDCWRLWLCLLWPYGPWSKIVHYIRNMVSFRIQPLSEDSFRTFLCAYEWFGCVFSE